MRNLESRYRADSGTVYTQRIVVKTILCTFIVYSAALFSSTNFSGQTETIEPWKESTIYIDPSGKENFEEIQGKVFEAASGMKVPNFGFTNSKLWMKFELSNTSKWTDFVLSIDHVYLNRLSVYHQDSLGNWQRNDMGLDFPKSESELDYYGYALKLNIPNGGKSKFFIAASSKYPINLPLTLETKEVFLNKLRAKDRIIWAYTGIVCVLIFYNFFIFIFARDPFYLYYILTLLTFHLFGNLAQYGMVRSWLLASSSWTTPKLFYLCHLLGVAYLNLFFFRFVKPRATVPKLSLTLKFFALTSLVLFIAGIFTETCYIDLFFQIDTTLYFLALLPVTYICAFKGNRPAKFFSVAWSLLIISWIINFLRIDGLVANNLFSGHIILFGAAIEGALLSLALADRLNTLRKLKDEAQKSVSETAARDEVARQVAHDIRSPLIALEAAISDLPNMAENRKFLIRNAAVRIKDIANDLLSRDKLHTSIGDGNILLISSALEMLITEKRAQYRNQSSVKLELTLSRESFGLFAEIDPAGFKRAISNVVDNAVQAIQTNGIVSVSVSKRDGYVEVKIADSGCGIPSEILTKLGNERVTFGKSGEYSGSGLGVFSTARLLHQWGGTLKFDSPPGEGTIARISLPLSPRPAWFVDSILVKPGSKVVVVDDEQTIFGLWKDRFQTLLPQGQLAYFSTPESFALHLKKVDAEEIVDKLFLIDFEFQGSDVTGIQLIEKHNLKNVILVTSHSEERRLQENCARLGIRILPKGLSNFVPILSQEQQLEKIVLIDDDQLVHEAWKLIAAGKNRALDTYFTLEEFLEKREKYGIDSAIYVDELLAYGVRGTDVTKHLHELGFNNLYIATGLSKDAFKGIFWVRGIHSKQFPQSKVIHL